MAYGARLESVLGASPRGFESRILRQSDMPSRARRLIERWRREHLTELEHAWDQVTRHELPDRIETP